MGKITKRFNRLNLKFNQVIKILIVAVMTIITKQGQAQHSEQIIIIDGIKTWVNVVGQGDKTPLILLHGGPGAPSYYLNPLSALSNERRVVFYDQPGCGRSYKVPDTARLTIDFFVDHLDKLRIILGFDTMYLYGQSWGSTLALEYYKRYPGHVKALIFSSPLLSVERWKQDASLLISSLSQTMQQAITLSEKTGDYSSPGYQSAVAEYYNRYVARKKPWSADIDSTFSRFGTAVYQAMWGPSEFTVTGTLKNYDGTAQLSQIKVPLLYLSGEFDEVHPETIAWLKQFTPGAQHSLIPEAAHLTMQDNTEADCRAIRSFLNSVP